MSFHKKMHIGVRRTIKIAAVVLGVVAIQILYHIGIMMGFWEPFRRPASVPRSAHYASMFEEGTWFDCSVDTIRNVNPCQAWDECGRPVAHGDYRLEGENRAATREELHPSKAISDGRGQAHMIYLFGNHGAFSKALVRVHEPDRK